MASTAPTSAATTRADHHGAEHGQVPAADRLRGGERADGGEAGLAERDGAADAGHQHHRHHDDAEAHARDHDALPLGAEHERGEGAGRCAASGPRGPARQVRPSTGAAAISAATPCGRIDARQRVADLAGERHAAAPDEAHDQAADEQREEHEEGERRAQAVGQRRCRSGRTRRPRPGARPSARPPIIAFGMLTRPANTVAASAATSSVKKSFASIWANSGAMSTPARLATRLESIHDTDETRSALTPWSCDQAGALDHGSHLEPDGRVAEQEGEADHHDDGGDDGRDLGGVDDDGGAPLGPDQVVDPLDRPQRRRPVLRLVAEPEDAG